MELHSFLTFIGGILVGMGVAVLIIVVAMFMWSRRSDS